jgi:rhodanese-related sulfurtransferase
LRERLDELPKDREIWLHCGVGKTSYYAARLLTQRGFRVRSLSGGFTSYKAMPTGKET